MTRPRACARPTCPFGAECESRPFDRLLESHPDPVLVVCAHDRRVVWANTVAHLAGLRLEGEFARCVDEPRRAEVTDAISRSLTGEEVQVSDVRVQVPHGREWRADVMPVLPYTGASTPAQIPIILRPRRVVDPQTIEAAVVERAGVVAAFTDVVGCVQWTSPRLGASAPRSAVASPAGEHLSTLLGCDARPIDEMLALVAPDDAPAAAARVTCRLDDRMREVELNAERLQQSDTDGVLWWVTSSAPSSDAVAAGTEGAAGYREVLEQIAQQLAVLGIGSGRSGTPLGRLRGWETLSERERTVIGFVAEGLRVSALADRLFVSESTVRNYLSSIYRKTSTDSLNHLRETLLSGGAGDE